MNAKEGLYCYHVEHRMPRSRKKTPVITLTDRIDNAAGIVEPKVASRGKLEQALRRHGLSDYEVKLILLRFYDGYSYKAIVQAHNWISIDSAAYHLRKALKKLKERGFKL